MLSAKRGNKIGEDYLISFMASTKSNKLTVQYSSYLCKNPVTAFKISHLGCLACWATLCNPLINEADPCNLWWHRGILHVNYRLMI